MHPMSSKSLQAKGKFAFDAATLPFPVGATQASAPLRQLDHRKFKPRA
jgi:hypothetical protein